MRMTTSAKILPILPSFDPAIVGPLLPVVFSQLRNPTHVFAEPISRFVPPTASVRFGHVSYNRYSRFRLPTPLQPPAPSPTPSPAYNMIECASVERTARISEDVSITIMMFLDDDDYSLMVYPKDRTFCTSETRQYLNTRIQRFGIGNPDAKIIRDKNLSVSDFMTSVVADELNDPANIQIWNARRVVMQHIIDRCKLYV